MRYLSLYTPAATGAERLPTNEHMTEMGKLIEELMESGELVTTGGLMPSSKGGARVRRTGESIALIDGPFAETKEMVGGFAILEAKSRNEAIALVNRFLRVAGNGETELYPIMEPPTAGANQERER